MNVDDLRMHQSERARKAHRAANIGAAAAPADGLDLEAQLSKRFTYGAVLPQEYHGKPITTGIQRARKVLDRERNASRFCLARSQDVNHMNFLVQVRGVMV